jgi:hypothetical protein
VIAHDQLAALPNGLLAPACLTILTLYLFFSGCSDVEALDEVQYIRALCDAETKIPPPNDGNMMFYVNWFTLRAATSCYLLVDEHGRSICSGTAAIKMHFLCVSIPDKEIARVYFRFFQKLTIGEPIFAIDLTSMELSNLDARVDFSESGIWKPGEGAAKQILVVASLGIASDGSFTLAPDTGTFCRLADLRFDAAKQYSHS